jgi:hypothetical protein
MNDELAKGLQVKQRIFLAPIASKRWGENHDRRIGTKRIEEAEWS